MDRLTFRGNRLLDRHDGRQLCKLHLDKVQRLIGDPLVGGRDRRDRVAHVADLLARQGFLVLADRKDAELDGQVVAGKDRQHARERPSPGDIDVQDPGVRVRAAQEPAKEHPRQGQVVRELCLSADLGEGVRLGQ